MIMFATVGVIIAFGIFVIWQQNQEQKKTPKTHK